jgi:LacI family transcriptional regulator
MSDADIAIDDHLVEQGTFSESSGEEAAQRLLALDERPTAIFCANDEMAIGCMNAARAFKCKCRRSSR